MPNRIIKESITTSCEIDQLTAEEERFFYRLIVVCDDFGRMDARPQVLRAKCFPLKVDSVKDGDVKKFLDGLVEHGLVDVYSVDGKPYLQMVTFNKHNSRRAKHSKYPDPHTSASICKQVHANVPETRDTRHEKRDDEKRGSDVDNIKKVIKAFEGDIHPLPTGSERESILGWLDEGMEPELIIWAMKQAALHSKRSMSYVNGILRNLHTNNVTTLAGAEARERDRQDRAKREGKPIEVKAPEVFRAEPEGPPDPKARQYLKDVMKTIGKSVNEEVNHETESQN